MMATIFLATLLGVAPPAGWIRSASPTAEQAQCASYSARRAEVSLLRNGVSVLLRSASQPRRVSLPFQIDYGALGVGPRAQQTAVHAADGWLVGFDGGEFGGGLWWFDAAGGNRARLSNENVRALLPNPRGRDGVIAVTGIQHQSWNAGKVLSLGRLDSGWRIMNAISLPSAGATAAIGPNETVLILTATDGLVAFDGHRIRKLSYHAFPGLYPSSMVSVGSVLYIGMRHFVVALSPRISGDGYDEYWFVPVHCPDYRLVGDNCECEDDPIRMSPATTR